MSKQKKVVRERKLKLALENEYLHALQARNREKQKERREFLPDRKERDV